MGTMQYNTSYTVPKKLLCIVSNDLPFRQMKSKMKKKKKIDNIFLKLRMRTTQSAHFFKADNFVISTVIPLILVFHDLMKNLSKCFNAL